MNFKKLNILLLVLCITTFLATFVSANAVTDWFANNFVSGQMDISIVKFLFWALVSIMVYSVIHMIPGLNILVTGGGFKQFLGVVFSAIVGFLSLVYIQPAELYAMVTSYTALGFVLGGGLPFIILLLFTLQLGLDRKKVTTTDTVIRQIIAIGMWLVFLGFMIYRTYMAFFVEGSNIPDWYIWSIVFIVALCFFMVFGGVVYIMKQVSNMATKAELEASKTTFNEAIAGVKNMSKVTRKTSKDDPTDILG